ncbi:MAG: hypothetical protein KAS78_02665 [Candidatus Pacebacteria bacterium]|nr:hypothetical protein [Candidatus Paceibacterota bacterium]
MTIVFKFNINDQVHTPFNERGIVEGLFFDGYRNQYSVRVARGDKWFKETELRILTGVAAGSPLPVFCDLENKNKNEKNR